MVRVDLGGSPNHIAKKAARDCSKRIEIPEFAELIEAQKFQLVVLTTTTAKARLIRQAMEGLSWQCNIRLHIATIPRLTFLHLRNH